MFKDDNATSDIEQIVEDNLSIPEELPILTLINQVAFPTLNMTLSIQAEATSLIEKAMKGDRIIGAVGIRKRVDDQPITKRVPETGTVIRILYATRASDNTTLLVARGLKRFRIDQWISEKPYLKARITLAPEIALTDIETDALFRSLRGLSQEVFSMMPNVRRCIQAGAVPMTPIATVLESQRDWANRDHYDALMNIFREHGGAYGDGIDYAYTMVHKAPQAAQNPHVIKK